MKLKGIVHKFGDNISTDEIIPSRYLNTTEPKELGEHCMEGIDSSFPKKIKKGDIMVVGKNFGCGSSREHAPLSIKGAGISCIIGKSFARIFYRNCINIGLPILELADISKIKSKDILIVDINTGQIEDITQKKTFVAQRFPPFMQEMVKAGGLLRYIFQHRRER